jgi:hypothetical protein
MNGLCTTVGANGTSSGSHGRLKCPSGSSGDRRQLRDRLGGGSEWLVGLSGQWSQGARQVQYGWLRMARELRVSFKGVLARRRCHHEYSDTSDIWQGTMNLRGTAYDLTSSDINESFWTLGAAPLLIGQVGTYQGPSRSPQPRAASLRRLRNPRCRGRYCRCTSNFAASAAYRCTTASIGPRAAAHYWSPALSGWVCARFGTVTQVSTELPLRGASERITIDSMAKAGGSTGNTVTGPTTGLSSGRGNEAPYLFQIAVSRKSMERLLTLDRQDEVLGAE